jgi:hypothetical protein
MWGATMISLVCPLLLITHLDRSLAGLCFGIDPEAPQNPHKKYNFFIDRSPLPHLLT